MAGEVMGEFGRLAAERREGTVSYDETAIAPIGAQRRRAAAGDDYALLPAMN